MRHDRPILILPISLLLALGLGTCRTAERLGVVSRVGWPRVLEAPYAKNGVTLDGVLDEWGDTQPVFYVDDMDPPQRNAARTWVMWDENALYVAFSIHDQFLRATHRERDTAFPDDGVEILIDTHLDRSDAWLPDDYCWHVNLLDTIQDDRGAYDGKIDLSWDGNAIAKTTILGTLNDDQPDEGYITEIAIPWSDLSLSGVGEGTELAMDFCVNDFDEDPDTNLSFDWCNLRIFHKPSGFGLVRLVKQLAIPATKPRSERLIW